MLKNLGNIESLENFSDYAVDEKGDVWSYKTNKYLKQADSIGHGLTYKRVSLCGNNGTRRSFRVHRLVALAFKYNKDHRSLTVNHIDENTFNNNADNLEWMTIKDNIRYSQADKTYVGNPDTLTKMYNQSNLNLKEFSKKFNVPLGTMWDILNKMGNIKNDKKRRVFDK